VPHPRGHHFALRMPGAGFLHILPGFPVAQGSLQLVTVAACRTASGRAGGLLVGFSYPDSIRTRARRFLRCIPSQVCFEPLTNRTRTSSGDAASAEPQAEAGPLALAALWHCPCPDSIRTRARRFLRSIPSQVCFELLTRTNVAFKRSSKHNHISRYTRR
jgi:hypothetical protein